MDPEIWYEGREGGVMAVLISTAQGTSTVNLATTPFPPPCITKFPEPWRAPLPKYILDLADVQGWPTPGPGLSAVTPYTAPTLACQICLCTLAPEPHTEVDPTC